MKATAMRMRRTEERWRATRVHVGGTHPDFPTNATENEIAKIRRAWVREVTAAIRTPLATALGLRESDLGMRWSAKAGCSCGCSPGWILDGHPSPNTIWIDVIDPQTAGREAATRAHNEIMIEAQKRANEAAVNAAREARDNAKMQEALAETPTTIEEMDGSKSTAKRIAATR